MSNNTLITKYAAAEKNIAALVKSFEESTAVHVKRTRAIGRLIAQGLSQRDVIGAVAAYTGGATPAGFSKSAVARYALVSAAITGDDMPALERKHTDDIIAILTTAAAYGGSSAVKTVRAAVIQNTGADAVTAARNTLDDMRAANVAALTADPKERGARPEGNAPAAEVESNGAESASTVTPASVPTASATGTLSLISELRARVGQRGFTVDASIAMELAALVETIEGVLAAIEAGELITVE